MWNPFFREPSSVLEASDGERQRAIEGLVEATTFRKGYYLLLTLSVIIVTCGLVVGNSPIVIGGMVLAPVLTPILLLAVSAVSRSLRGTWHALTILALSVGLTLALSAGLTWIIVRAPAATALVPSPIPPLVYLLIALCSGIVASLAWVKKELASTIAGIAISVSLLPPLCTAGIGLALGYADLMRSALLVFTTNVFGILGAAIITFILLGFARLGRVTERTMRHETETAEEQR